MSKENDKKFNLGEFLDRLMKSEEKSVPPEPVQNEQTPTSSYVLESVAPNHIFQLELDAIVPNPHQPRSDFNEATLEELAESIKEHGIIQPLVVSKVEYDVPEGTKVKYHIITGERRWRAARLAGLPTVPAIIRDTTENQKLEVALVENLQRQNLNPIEEAQAYKKLMEDFSLNQQEVAYKIGKSPEKISNTIRLLNLPLEVQNALSAGLITEGHGRAILSLVGPERQRALLREILDKGFSVRQVEEKVREVKDQAVRSPRSVVTLSPEFKALVERLENVLGTRVSLRPKGEGGRITIEYYSAEELENILKTFLEAKEKGEELP